jgi:predicted NBD/HSP70 family sugar kinase
VSSALDDRKAWLSSIAQAVVGKTLENLKDDDEALLFDKMKDLVFELDTLAEITSSSKEEDEAIGIEITSPGSNHRGISRYPAQKSEEVKKLADAIREQLGKDKNLNIAALANLLKEMM